MSASRILAGVAFSLAVSVNAAASTSFFVRFHGPDPAPESVDLILSRHDAAHVMIPVMARVNASVTADIPAGLWRVEVADQKVWAKPLLIDTAAPSAHTLDVEPAGAVVGEITAEVEEQSDLVIAFAHAGTLFPLRPETAACSVKRPRFECKVPVGNRDLRFKLTGSAPRYVWNVRVKSGTSATPATDVGLLNFAGGGSFAGVIAMQDISESLGKLRIIARAAMPDGSGKYYETSASVRPNGFFWSDAIPPGIYSLRAELSGVGIADVPIVSVRPGLEARIPEEVVLFPPSLFTIVIDPKTHPEEGRWLVQVQRQTKTGGVPAARAYVSADGMLELDTLAPGTHVLLVSDGTGSRWAEQTFEVGDGSSTVNVRIPLIAVEGRLQRGARLVDGTIWFGRRSGVQSVQMKTDGTGHFSGILPRPGEWDVEVHLLRETSSTTAKTVVERDDEGGRAVADIRLPESSLRGSVTDPAGRPVAGASVSLTQNRARAGGATTDAGGHFEIVGVQPGPAIIRASASTGSTAQVAITITSENPPVALRLEPHRSVTGLVVGPSGPVPGARIAVWSPAGGMVEKKISGTDGRFVVRLPAGSETANIAVYALGLALHLGTVSASSTSDAYIPLTSTFGELEITSTAPLLSVGRHGIMIPATVARDLLSPASVRANEGMTSVWFGNLPPGTYEVCALNRDRKLGCVAGSLAPASRLELKIAH